MILDSFLQFSERYAVERDTSAVIRQLLAQLLDLQLSAVGGVRRAYIVYSRDVYASFRHHIAGYRTIDSAGQQKHSLAAASYGKSAGTLDILGVYVSIGVTDLYSYRHLRILNIDGQIRELIKEYAAQLRADLRRIHRERLIRALRIDLEGLCAAEYILKILYTLRGYVCEVLFTHTRTAQSSDSEDLANDLHQVYIVHRFYVQGTLGTGIVYLSETFQSALYVLGEHILKGLFIKTFQHHLTVFYKYYLFHYYSPILLIIYNISRVPFLYPHGAPLQISPAPPQ